MVLVAFEIYGPALHGPFVFDDLYLTYAKPHAAIQPMSEWCGLRPILGLSFWANFEICGVDTFAYHAVNVFLHCGSAILVFFIVWKILEKATGQTACPRVLCGFAAVIFLVHPVQTEAVAYIASRSENLSVFFIFGALCVFLYRRSPAVSWGTAAAVLGLFVCAIGTKEHAIALPAVLLLTDYFWNPGFSTSGIRANWRLYGPMALAGCAAAAVVWEYVSHDAMIGFHIDGLTWYQYFFTECRAVFAYAGMFLLPLGQNVDHDFPISHSVFEHGAIFALAAAALLAMAAIVWRRRYPLAAYGYLVFLVLLAPTSSFIPIHDVFVERRLYLPMIGLILMMMEPLRRLTVRPRVLAMVLAVLCLTSSYLTWQRAHVWASVENLWLDSAAKSPQKVRPHVGLGNAYLHENRCGDAAREYEAAYHLDRPDFSVKYNLAAAYDCLHQPDRAANLLQEAIAEKANSASSYALLGRIYAEKKQWQEGLDALNRAQELDPNYALTYAYRGLILATLGRPDLAAREFENCLRIDPNNELARRGLAGVGN